MKIRLKANKLRSQFISTFSNKFKIIAQQSKIRYMCNSIEQNLIEVHINDLESFFKALS